ncbi:hypothetical protein B0H11DRAFT_2049251 [Mycena galericulata]|nr:hypothetical protein B0H11DRAFT_2049251 [Mycena galericulata]
MKSVCSRLPPGSAPAPCAASGESSAPVRCSWPSLGGLIAFKTRDAGDLSVRAGRRSSRCLRTPFRCTLHALRAVSVSCLIIAPRSVRAASVGHTPLHLRVRRPRLFSLPFTAAGGITPRFTFIAAAHRLVRSFLPGFTPPTSLPPVTACPPTCCRHSPPLSAPAE